MRCGQCARAAPHSTRSVVNDGRETRCKESLRKRGDPGSWEYILELGKQPAQRCTECSKRYWVDRSRLEKCPACEGKLVDTEERRQKSLGGFRTKKEAQEALDKVKVAVAENRYVVMTNVTVRSFLVDEWLPTIKSTVRPRPTRATRAM